jgi:hypothetical protein
MSENQEEPNELDRDELEELEGEELPDREAMSVIDVGGPLGGPFVEPIGGQTLPVEPPQKD